MDEASKHALKRLIRSGEIDLDSLFTAIKNEILSQLQGCESPDQAFHLKQKLDVTDDLRLHLQRIADEESTV